MGRIMEKIRGPALKKALEKQNPAYTLHNLLSSASAREKQPATLQGGTALVTRLKYRKTAKQTSSV